MSLYEREVLYALKLQNKSFREIGKLLGRSHTTLSREYERNAHHFSREYIPCLADKKSEKKALDQRYKAPLKNPFIFVYVRKRLRIGWSPEQIAGRLRIDHSEYSIHCETIYRYIYNSKKTRGMRLYQYLKNHRKQRMKKIIGRKIKKSKIPNIIRIDQRPEVINTRTTVGHWETDNMIGNQSDYLVLSVTTERKTRYSVLSLVKRGAMGKNQALSKLSTLHPDIVNSVTADNGTEHAKYEVIKKQLSIPFFFCYPYHSWEKGTVENTIGRIRKILPKKQTLIYKTEEEIELLESWLNNQPRKCLNWLTPAEALQTEYDQLQSTKLQKWCTSTAN